MILPQLIIMNVYFNFINFTTVIKYYDNILIKYSRNDSLLKIERFPYIYITNIWEDPLACMHVMQICMYRQYRSLSCV